MQAERWAVPLRMVWRRPLRSLLAALGLAITLAALLFAVALAQKGKTRVLNEIDQIGADVLIVSAQPARNRGGRVRSGNEVTTLTLADARLIERQVAGVAGIAAEYRTEVTVKAGEFARQPRVAGIEPSYAFVRQAPLRAGRFFDEADDVQGQRVAVLGGRIARELFAGEDPIGATLRLRGIAFTVLGVLHERGSGLDAFNEDEVIFIPLRTARRRLFQADHVQRLFVRVKDADMLQDVSAGVVAMLQARRPALNGVEALDFRVQDQARLVAVRAATVRRLSAFQVEVSLALLCAGALGVFALQLLSVRERRAEIGTRRALGASRRTIFLQFLIEAALVCVTGAVVGIGLGVLGTVLAGAQFSARPALVAFLAFCGAGLLAGVAPARAAAALHPAVALRAQ